MVSGADAKLAPALYTQADFVTYDRHDIPFLGIECLGVGP